MQTFFVGAYLHAPKGTIVQIPLLGNLPLLVFVKCVSVHLHLKLTPLKYVVILTVGSKDSSSCTSHFLQFQTHTQVYIGVV